VNLAIKSFTQFPATILVMGVALLLLPTGSHSDLWAQTQKSGPAEQSSLQNLLRKDNPIHITSDKLEVDQKGGTILFEGHVVAQQENLTITGKKLTVFAVKNKVKGNKTDADKSGVIDRVDRIEVDGEVKITQGEKVATCDKATHYRQDQKIVLSGNPQVSQGKDVLRGRLITLYLQEERSVVEGGAEAPVQATIYPDGKKQP
jgi:lipopolysaccharide export system protein LptA